MHGGEQMEREEDEGSRLRRLMGLTDGVQGVSQVLPAAITNQGVPAQTLLTWRDPNKVPRHVGVHLFLNKQAFVATGGVVQRRDQVTARLGWGHSGGKFNALCDVMQGVSLLVWASYVEVEAVNTSEAIAAATAHALPISGSITPNASSGAGFSQPRFSVAFTGAASTVIPIPLFARTLDIVRGISAAVTVVATFRAFGAAIVGQFTMPAGQDLLPRAYPIPHGAATVDIAAVGSGELEAIFYLDL